MYFPLPCIDRNTCTIAWIESQQQLSPLQVFPVQLVYTRIVPCILPASSASHTALLYSSLIIVTRTIKQYLSFSCSAILHIEVPQLLLQFQTFHQTHLQCKDTVIVIVIACWVVSEFCNSNNLDEYSSVSFSDVSKYFKMSLKINYNQVA